MTVPEQHLAGWRTRLDAALADPATPAWLLGLILTAINLYRARGEGE